MIPSPLALGLRKTRALGGELIVAATTVRQRVQFVSTPNLRSAARISDRLRCRFALYGSLTLGLGSAGALG